MKVAVVSILCCNGNRAERSGPHSFVPGSCSIAIPHAVVAFGGGEGAFEHLELQRGAHATCGAAVCSITLLGTDPGPPMDTSR